VGVLTPAEAASGGVSEQEKERIAMEQGASASLAVHLAKEASAKGGSAVGESTA